MNVCSENHHHIYKIIYRGTRGSRYNPEWLVCQMCIDNKAEFANNDEIISIKTLREDTPPKKVSSDKSASLLKQCNNCKRKFDDEGNFCSKDCFLEDVQNRILEAVRQDLSHTTKIIRGM